MVTSIPPAFSFPHLQIRTPESHSVEKKSAIKRVLVDGWHFLNIESGGAFDLATAKLKIRERNGKFSCRAKLEITIPLVVPGPDGQVGLDRLAELTGDCDFLPELEDVSEFRSNAAYIFVVEDVRNGIDEIRRLFRIPIDHFTDQTGRWRPSDGIGFGDRRELDQRLRCGIDRLAKEYETSVMCIAGHSH